MCEITRLRRTSLKLNFLVNRVYRDNALHPFRELRESGNREEIPEKRQSVYRGTWHVAGGFPLLSQERLVRACHFSCGGFRRLCSSSISKFEPRLSPPVHYLNKQEKQRGRLAAACTAVSLSLSPVFSFFLHNKCASQLSLSTFSRFLAPASSPSLSLFVILARSSALSKRYSDEQLSLPREERGAKAAYK